MHTQLINSGPKEDSFRACVATILEYKDINLVPNFKTWQEKGGVPLGNWLLERGLSLIVLRFKTYEQLLNQYISARRHILILNGYVLDAPDARQSILCGTKNNKITVIHNPSNPERHLDYERGDFTLYILTKAPNVR